MTVMRIAAFRSGMPPGRVWRMGRLFSFMAVSADGYHASPDRDVAWQTFGPEFADYSVEQLDEVATLVFGRTTFEELSAYWPTERGAAFDPRIAERMNRLPKLVVSTSLTSASWPGSEASVVTVDELADNLRTQGNDVAVLGSSTLTAALLRAKLVDELRLMVNPILLGDGLKLFDGAGTVPLELTRTRPFASGNVLLYYRTAR
jgi:dihydrofolate reductase